MPVVFSTLRRALMSNANASSEWPAWVQAGLFFVLAFGGIQGVSAMLQGTITLPALVSALIAALTGAGIVYSYEWRRQAGVFDPPPAPKAEASQETDVRAPNAEASASSAQDAASS